MIKEITSEQFKQEIFDYSINENWKYENQLPSVIKFGADWCGPCKQIEPILEELSEEYKDKINFYKIDVDENHEVASVFQIRSIPAMLFIPLNNDTPRMDIGSLPKSHIIQIIEDVLNVKL